MVNMISPLQGFFIPSLVIHRWSPRLTTHQFISTTSPTHSPSTPPSNPTSSTQSTDVEHAEFLHEGRHRSTFKPSSGIAARASDKELQRREEKVEDQWVGKLSPTSTHLFKLLLPLPKSLHRDSTSPSSKNAPIQTAYLLHPSQPLSHLSRLILGSLPHNERRTEIEFRASSLADHSSYPSSSSSSAKSGEKDVAQDEHEDEGGPLLHERIPSDDSIQEVRWSPSTDLCDFIKQATVEQSFRIVLIPQKGVSPKGDDDGTMANDGQKEEYDETDGVESVGESDRKKHQDLEARSHTDKDIERSNELSIKIMIPSFASRTVYLRKRLLHLTKEIQSMTELKKQLDHEAHKGARRIAISGLAGLVAYWGVVCKLTFFSSLGWDVMEPITYLSGLTTVIGGYLFFLYHNREVSYSSILDLSVSARQRNLYSQKGLDVERWTEMVAEAKTLRKEISRIAADYDYDWKGQLQNLGKDDVSNVRKRKVVEQPTRSAEGQDERRTREHDLDQRSRSQNDKLDVSKTIDEAVELEEQTKSKGRRGRRIGGDDEAMDASEEEGHRKGRMVVDENT